MTDEKEVSRQLLVAKIFHASLLSTVPIVLAILVLLPGLGFIPVFASDDPALVIVEVVIGGFSLLCLAIGFYWPRLSRLFKTESRVNKEMFFGHIFRVSFFECLVAFGLILRILGSSWLVVLPFFVLASVMFILTFPTNKRLTEWRRSKEPTAT